MINDDPRGELPVPGSSQLKLIVWLLQNVGGTVLVTLMLGYILYLSEHLNSAKLDLIVAQQAQISATFAAHESGIFKAMLDGESALRVNQDRIFALMAARESLDAANTSEMHALNEEEIRQLHDIVNLLVDRQRLRGKYGMYVPSVRRPPHLQLDAMK